MPTDPDELIDPSPEVVKLRRFDVRSLWRTTFWGCAAAIAVTVVAGTAFSDVGAERLKVAIASVLEPVQGPPQQSVALQRTDELQKQTQQLADTVRELTADRDRLKGRLALLEQGLDDITGAIKRQASQPPQQPPKPVAAAPAPPPAVSVPPATTASIGEPAPQPAASSPVQAATPTPPAASAPETATPANVPIPPARTAALAQPATAQDQPAEATPPPKRELGVDLGGAATIEALRAHWATIKANIGPDIVGMSPSYAQRLKSSGTLEYRLIVGPFPNTAAAIRLCTKLTPMRITCRAGMFNVQQFAER
jgi:hypothetical protein